MKKFLFILPLVLLSLFFKTPTVFASVLYQNSFNSTSLSDWTKWSLFDVCDDSLGTLTTLNNTRCALKYNSTFPNLACISADFDTTNTSSDYLFFTGDGGGGAGLGDWDIVFAPDDGTRHIALGDGPHNVRYVSNIDTPIGVHSYMLCKDGDTFRGYLDNAEVLNYTHSGMNEYGFSIVTNGSANQASNSISNFVATDSIPIITPTPSPSNDLSVPLLKQTSEPWQSHEYDSAHVWSPSDMTIHDWGCALTSAAMVLQYHHINQLPDGTPLDPGTLNTWLQNQPDGYIGSGLLNWLAITRLSKQSKSNGYAPLFAADALEFVHKNFPDTALLHFDLGLQIPDILEVPGHFIVAKGENGTTYDINDPYYNRNTLNDGYSNTFVALNEFYPSFTNLSYIMLTGDSNLTFTVTTSTGSATQSFTQNPITNENTGLPSGQSVSLLYFQKPPTGDYTITVTGDNSQVFDFPIYFYNTDGNVQVNYLEGSIPANGDSTISLHFDQNNLANNTMTRIVTPQILIDDLHALSSQKLLKQGLFTSLSQQAKNLQKDISRNDIFAAKIKLGVMKILLQIPAGQASDEAYQILKSDIDYLLSH